MQVRDIQHRPAVTCGPTTTIAEAAELMRAENVGFLIVLDDKQRIIGVVTDRDIVVRGMAGGFAPSSKIDQVMTRDVCYVFENADLSTAATEMAARAVRRLPVLNTEGHLTGVIAFDDLMISYSEEMDRLARAVRKEIMTAPLPR